MKRWIWRGTLFLIPVLVTLAFAAGPKKATWRAGTALLDNETFFDANSLLMFVTNTGSFAYDQPASMGKNDGLYFPRGTDLSVIFAAGLWMGALVDGAPRIVVAEYSSEFAPGPMKDGTFQVDNAGFRVYKVNKGDTRDSSDYAEWPFDEGAPSVKDFFGNDSLDADGFRIPLIQGDQALWAVFNDADPEKHNNNAGSTAPLGVEVQAYVFGYARAGALGQTIFMRYTIINKGGNDLDSAYITLWCDPDVGDFADDLVGCDTELSLGYCYNSGEDGIYGAAPPAVGYDFFQGPIVPVPPGEVDSAWISSKGEFIHGYRNLPMTSFNRYLNIEDPQNNIETYRYILGLKADGSPHINPITGEPSTFTFSGDPVRNDPSLDWVDFNPADRRFMMSSGPFQMAPGDTQEVVAAVLVGRGSDHLSSVTALKLIDATAQLTFDKNFDIPGPPPLPSLWAVPHEGAVQLFWGFEADGDIQYGEGPPDSLGNVDTLKTFVMEGLNVYQGPSSSGPWTKIATFDINNGVQRIYADVDQEEGVERIVVQKGTDSGLEHDLWVTRDRVAGGDLIDNRPYFFTVTAYNYDVQNTRDYLIGGSETESYGVISESFENLPGANVVEVAPRSVTGILADTADHVSGTSDGFVLVDYTDQSLITGDTYRVDFNEDGTWNLYNESEAVYLLSDQSTIRPPDPVDGFFLRVSGPEFGVKSVAEVANADGPVDPPVDVHSSLNSTEDWYIDPGGGLSRYTWAGATDHDYEIRFTQEATEYCWDWFGLDDTYSLVFQGRVPIEFWDITDNRRITFMLIDDDNSGDFSWGDGLYIWDLDYDDIPWETPDIHTGQFDPDEEGLHYGRWWFYDESGLLTRPAPGTIIRTITNKPNVVGDVFQFVAQMPGTVDGTSIAESVDDVHPVPNPYYNLTDLENDQFSRQIKFINLPAARTTIRIFNLAGDLVRTIVKDEPGAGEVVWNTLTENGIPVASGLYIYHVEAQGLGTKIGKLAVFTEVEQLDTY